MGYDVYGLNPKQNTEVPTLVNEFHTVNWEDTTQEQRDEYFKLKGEWEKENPGYNNNPKKLDTWQKSLSAISPEPSIKEKCDKAIKKKLAKLASIKEAMNSVKE